MTDAAESQEIILKRRSEALRYLHKRGYKISTGKFYQDHKAKKVKTDEQGHFTSTLLEKYAREQGLLHLGLEENQSSSLSQLQEQKLQKEIQKLDWENKRKELEYEKEMGKYIPRDQFDLEVASRAAVFDSVIKSKIKDNALHLIWIVDGDPQKKDELQRELLDIIDLGLNELARMDSFQVIFESDE